MVSFLRILRCGILKAAAPTDLLRPQRAALHKPGFLIVDRSEQPIPLYKARDAGVKGKAQRETGRS
jgi:hypothetical protein